MQNQYEKQKQAKNKIGIVDTKKSVFHRVKQVSTYTLLAIWALINIFPIYYMFTFSLKDNGEIFGQNVIGLPQDWIWKNYEDALNVGNMGRFFINSFIVSGVTILIVIVFSIMATFALTRMIWRGRKVVNSTFMLGLTVPIHAAILPVFLLLSKLKMLDSYESLIIPYAAFGLAMAILIFTGFMQDIPKELDEAACLDGCNTWGILFKIILPLMKPAMATAGIFTFLSCWNELMFATIFISKSEYRTLTVGLQTLTGSYTTQWGPIGAALTLATLPTLVIYIFLSKRIQRSFVAGAVKG